MEHFLPVSPVMDVKCAEIKWSDQGHIVADLNLTQLSSRAPHTILPTTVSL